MLVVHTENDDQAVVIKENATSQLWATYNIIINDSFALI